MRKTYKGTFKFGETTPSYDLETKVNQIYKHDHIEINKLIKSSKNFIGKILQKPPIFSAIKKNGKRSYEYARENKKIEIRGFGTMSKKINKEKYVRNPRTNEKIFKKQNFKIHFKISKILNKEIN